MLVGEPGNGKTFFVEFLCRLYREFLATEQNRKYTFRFTGLDRIGSYGKITTIESQTYEDPVILAMNLLETPEENRSYLARKIGFTDDADRAPVRELPAPGRLQRLHLERHPRPLRRARLRRDAQVRRDHPGAADRKPGHGHRQVPGQGQDHLVARSTCWARSRSSACCTSPTPTTPTGSTCGAGALARVAGGGIHFSDEIFKNKKDLVQVYLGVIQNRTIEIDGFKWPIDTLIIATSNNSEFNRFLAEKEEAPIVDRCRICYVSHNTNYQLQSELTQYAIGSETKTTLTNEDLHQDPNLNYAASVAVVLTRLPRSEKLTPIETMKLAAGEVAGEKSIKTLAEVIDTLNQDTDITNRFGQKGLGQRNLGRAIQLLVESSRDQRGRAACSPTTCSRPSSGSILDYVTEPNDRAKYLEDLKTARGLYRERIMTEMFNAYMDEPHAIRKDVHELRQHDHRHRRREPRSGQDVEVQGSPDRRAARR